MIPWETLTPPCVLDWDAATGQARRSMTFDWAARYVLSADRSTIAVQDDASFRRSAFRVVDRASGRTKVRVTDTSLHPSTLSGTGAWFATTTDGQITIWDTGTGEAQSGFVQAGHKPGRLRFSPAGKKLVSVDSSGTVILWHVETGQVDRVFRHSEARTCYWASFAPDGGQLLVYWSGSAPVLLDLDTDASPHADNAYPVRGFAFAFDPTGRRLASTDHGDVHVW